LTLRELQERVPSEEIVNCDGYYRRVKRFRAFAIEAVLAQGFRDENVGTLSERPWVLRARDGYTVPLSGQRLLEGGAYIAFADAEHPGRWDPIGPQRADPAPFYLVWRDSTQCDLETHPRPWQLAVLEIARYESVFPHSVPHGVEPSSGPYRGFQRFASLCIRCHAINREGGRVGPELNVPQNITEYRPGAQIRAYIRNPLTFRYGNMPAHPTLDDAALDDLLAYLTHMRDEKHDPDAPDSGYLRDL
jgi:mono/diheme cytochrome c family protein